MLTGSQTALVTETLRVSLVHAAASSDGGPLAQALTDVAAALPAGDAGGRPLHPALPRVGSTVTRELIVAGDDTAAAMGHPDGTLKVLGSPRIALWFEVVASELLPAPTPDLTHVGVGILVHHLARAEVGERVTVGAAVEAAAGRHVVFSCSATVGARVVALGVHQRVVVEAK